MSAPSEPPTAAQEDDAPRRADLDYTPFGRNNGAPGSCTATSGGEWDWICTREASHPADWHIAGDGDSICEVWPVTPPADAPEQQDDELRERITDILTGEDRSLAQTVDALAALLTCRPAVAEPTGPWREQIARWLDGFARAVSHEYADHPDRAFIGYRADELLSLLNRPAVAEPTGDTETLSRAEQVLVRHQRRDDAQRAVAAVNAQLSKDGEQR